MIFSADEVKEMIRKGISEGKVVEVKNRIFRDALKTRGRKDFEQKAKELAEELECDHKVTREGVKFSNY